MSTLTKYEMAALTAQVPCTDDPHLNTIISVSLRIKIGAEILKAMVSNPEYKNTSYEVLAAMALGTAQIYLKQIDSALSGGNQDAKST